MASQIVRWWPRSKPVPKGWIRVATAPSHHDAHSVLITPKSRPLTRRRAQAQYLVAG